MDILGEWIEGTSAGIPDGELAWSGPSRYQHTATVAGKPVAFVERRGPGKGLWVGRINGWRWIDAENVAADLVATGQNRLPVRAFEESLREAKRAIETVLNTCRPVGEHEGPPSVLGGPRVTR